MFDDCNKKLYENIFHANFVWSIFSGDQILRLTWAHLLSPKLFIEITVHSADLFVCRLSVYNRFYGCLRVWERMIKWFLSRRCERLCRRWSATFIVLNNGIFHRIHFDIHFFCLNSVLKTLRKSNESHNSKTYRQTLFCRAVHSVQTQSSLSRATHWKWWI